MRYPRRTEQRLPDILDGKIEPLRNTTWSTDYDRVVERIKDTHSILTLPYEYVVKLGINSFDVEAVNTYIDNGIFYVSVLKLPLHRKRCVSTMFTKFNENPRNPVDPIFDNVGIILENDYLGQNISLSFSYQREIPNKIERHIYAKLEYPID